MAIGIDDLDFDEDFMNNPNNAQVETEHEEFQEPDNDPQDQEIHEKENETDVVTELLKKQGIEDPSKIKFEDENGNIEDVDWNTLSLEEQIAILNPKEDTSNNSKTQVNNTNLDLDQDIMSLAQELKDNNMSVDDFISYIKNQGAQEYANSIQPTYKVDDLTDDDLFIIDLKNRIPDITQEQLDSALEQAKSNEELYQKQVKGIREEYKQFEEEENAQNQAILNEEQQQQYNEFANNIATTIDSLDNVNGIDIELDNDDKYELAQFILGQDASGVSNLGKALNDPETLVKVAWFALKGADAIDSITDYFKNEIASVRESSYKKGLEDANKKKESKTRVVTTKPFIQKTKKVLSIDDLD